VGLCWIRILIEEFIKLMSATYNITINQNSDFVRSFQVKENNVILDITGYTFAGTLAENYNTTVSQTFTTAVTDGPAGVFTVSLTDTETAALDPGTWVYDVLMTDSAAKRTRMLQGNAFVKQGVTL
tara:strand:+ start:201 stop:578 length:378 start_codon:yes stop_codon:yes gene_type:complete